MTDTGFIYMDNSATTPMSSEAVESMLPYLTTQFGNPSSQHGIGRQAAEALNDAREKIASVLECRPSAITFTSGGTEANNLAIKGTWLAGGTGSIVTSAIEHKSVLAPAASVSRREGLSHQVIGVDGEGLIDALSLERVVSSDALICSIMYANNEIGSVQPIAEVASLCKERSIVFHCDAVQAPGLLPIAVDTIGADLISFSAHKCGGPKGIGLLYRSAKVPLAPQIEGGGQERELRSGTENVAAIVGMATALEVAESNRLSNVKRLTAQRERLIAGVLSNVTEAFLTGPRDRRLAHHASFCFTGISGDAVLQNLEMAGICCSSGSACSAGEDEASHVLLAIGMDGDVARTSVRFTLSAATTDAEIDTVIKLVPRAVRSVLSLR